MLPRWRRLEARLLPHGSLDVVRQLLLFGTAYYAYRLVRGAADGQVAVAFDHARDLISIERSLHTFVEPAVQGWASGQEWLIDACSWIYLNAQFSIALGALVFIYLFHNPSFYFVRNMFMFAMAFALVGYLLYPTAPPRFLPEWGFTDSVSAVTGVPQDSVAVNALFNPFAAVPSMHVAFALMLGWPIARLSRARVVRIFWFAWPFIVTFAVVATANHYWLDAVLGALVAAASAYLAAALARARPHVWAFSPVRVGVPA